MAHPWSMRHNVGLVLLFFFFFSFHYNFRKKDKATKSDYVVIYNIKVWTTRLSKGEKKSKKNTMDAVLNCICSITCYFKTNKIRTSYIYFAHVRWSGRHNGRHWIHLISLGWCSYIYNYFKEEKKNVFRRINL